MADNQTALSSRGPELNPKPVADSRATNEISLTSFIELMLRWLAPLLAAGLVGGVLLGGLALLQEPTYTATLTFMPQASGGNAANPAGAAGRLFGFGGANDPESPGFYAELLRTRELLIDVANAEYEVAVDGAQQTGTMIDLLELERRPGVSEAAHRRMVMEVLESMIDAGATMIGFVEIRVTAPWPDLAEQAAARALAVLQEFNARRRTALAAAEKQFTREQMERAQTELFEAEDNLERFLESNRQYESSPQLLLKYNRLQRQVGYRLQIYSQLTHAYYQARIDEVRGAPKITIIEPAQHSAIRNPRGVVRWAVIGSISFAGLMLLVALVVEFLRARRQEALAHGGNPSVGARPTIGDLLRRFGRSSPRA